jgi:hypothetical protein
MNPDQSAYGMAMMGHDIGDFCDLIWANAARGTGPGRAKAPKPDKPSSPSHPISQRKDDE